MAACGLVLLPEHVNHLAVRANRCAHTAAERLGDDVADVTLEADLVGLIVAHERGKRVVGVEDDQVADMLRALDVDEACGEMFEDGRGVQFSRDDDRRLSRNQTFAQETGDGGEEGVIISVELDRVLVRV